MEQHLRFLFRPEYLWPKDKETAPFFTVPAWWRRFIFRVLRPRDITVYHYYLSVMNQAGTAFPTIEQIASDLGIADRDSVRKAIARLVECGFLLKPDDAERQALGMGKRSVYQRPCPQFTILKLIQIGEIDGELFPARDRQRHDVHDKSSDPVVRAGLRNLLGEMFPAYEEARRLDDEHREERTKRILAAMLAEKLETMEARGREASDEHMKRRPLNRRVLEALPERVKAEFFRVGDAVIGASQPKRIKAGRRAKRKPAASRARASVGSL